MQSHQTGAIKGTRNGSEVVHHTIPIDYTSVTGTQLKVLMIDGSLANPVFYRAKLYLETPFNAGTTGTISIGTTAGGVDLIAATDVRGTSAGTNTVPSTAAENKLASAQVDIYANLLTTGTVPTAGKAWIVVEVFEANLKAPNNQGD